MPELEKESEIIEAFSNNIKQKKYKNSLNLAINTVQQLRKIISQTKWSITREMLDLIKAYGKEFMETSPSETVVVGNMTRRLLKIIRDDYAALQKGKQEDSDLQESLQKLVSADKGELDYSESIQPFRSEILETIMEDIRELLTELKTSQDAIADQASKHIHANEIIMTIGRSRTVESFLINAAKERIFQVIVAECAPFYHGHKLAANLAKAGILTTLVPDSAIFAMMARVNKVIIGTHSVMANGGLKSITGTRTLALAAKYYSVPLIVCTSLYKLCPEFVCSLDQDGFNQFASPEQVISGSEGQLLSAVQVYNPVFDYVPPELVTLFISNTGGHAPSYIYRLLSELYHPLDYNL